MQMVLGIEHRASVGCTAACLEGGPVPSLGEGEHETTFTFCAIYLSLSLHVAKTVADGDCGLDVMRLMLAWKRCKHNRDVLRNELCAFALKHVGNRAFAATLHEVGELRAHLGFFELDSAAAALLADEPEDVEESHHGDGAAPPAVPQTPTPPRGTSAMRTYVR